MSIPEMVRELESLEEIRIRGTLSIENLVRRQIDRCNMSIAAADPSVFEGNVRALMKHLPANTHQEVLGKQSEFNSTVESYVFKETCGHNIGTVKNPFVSVPGHPEWDFLLDVPKPYRETRMDEIDIISPIKVEETVTDYEKLYEVVLQALEGLGLTWNIEKRTVEMGKVIKTKIPDWLVNNAEQAVVDIMMKARTQDSKFNEITFNLLVEELRERTPPTPVI